MVVIQPTGEQGRFVEELCGVQFDPLHEPPSLVLPNEAAALIIRADLDGTVQLQVKGPHTRASELPLEGARWAVGAALKPGAARSFLDIPLDAIAETVRPLRSLWTDAPDFGDRDSTATMQGGVKLLLSLIERRVGNAESVGSDERLIERAVSMLGAEPEHSIAALAEALNLSARQLRRKFHAWVGMGPKAYGGLLRFRGAVERMASSRRPEWAALAAESGYYDQAHMIADFRERTGRTPAVLHQELA